MIKILITILLLFSSIDYVFAEEQNTKSSYDEFCKCKKDNPWGSDNYGCYDNKPKLEKLQYNYLKNRLSDYLNERDKLKTPENIINFLIKQEEPAKYSRDYKDEWQEFLQDPYYKNKDLINLNKINIYGACLEVKDEWLIDITELKTKIINKYRNRCEEKQEYLDCIRAYNLSNKRIYLDRAVQYTTNSQQAKEDIMFNVHKKTFATPDDLLNSYFVKSRKNLPPVTSGKWNEDVYHYDIQYKERKFSFTFKSERDCSYSGQDTITRSSGWLDFSCYRYRYYYDEYSCSIKQESIQDIQAKILKMEGVFHSQSANQLAVQQHSYHDSKYSYKECISSPSGSGGSYTPCNYGDTCFEVLRKINNYRYEIKCTKGSNKGMTREVCGNNKGKWATGCGFTDAFAYHDNSMTDAANDVCD